MYMDNLTLEQWAWQCRYNSMRARQRIRKRKRYVRYLERTGQEVPEKLRNPKKTRKKEPEDRIWKGSRHTGKPLKELPMRYLLAQARLAKKFERGIIMDEIARRRKLGLDDAKRL